MRSFFNTLIGRHFIIEDSSTTEPFSGGDSEESLFEEPEPWIGVDLDGTLAHYDGWRGPRHIGKPIPAMMARVKQWREMGTEVKIFTARASVPEMIPPIKKWLKKHGLGDMDVTNQKDLHMIELWDDRAVQVIMNTGQGVIDPSFMAQPRSALMGLEKSYQEANEPSLSYPLPENKTA